MLLRHLVAGIGVIAVFVGVWSIPEAEHSLILSAHTQCAQKDFAK